MTAGERLRHKLGAHRRYGCAVMHSKSRARARHGTETQCNFQLQLHRVFTMRQHLPQGSGCARASRVRQHNALGSQLQERARALAFLIRERS